MENSKGYSPQQTENKSMTISKRKRSKKGKRFSDEQIKSLESIFKVENKLEAKKKVKVARDLGLQPRQVAIWFQNRRARWKSKQIEDEYKQLQAGFHTLSMQFESLKKEKQSLLIRVERLNNLLGSPNDERIKNKDNNLKEEPPSSLKEGLKHHERMHTNKNILHQKEEEPESFKFGDQYEYGDTSLASPEEWCNLDLGGLFNQSCGTSKWWDF